MGYTCKNAVADGIIKDGKDINVSLIFLTLDNCGRFQSAILDMVSEAAGHKRPLIEVEDVVAPHDVILRSEHTETVLIAGSTTKELDRVFRYCYAHDDTTEDIDNSAECDGFSDVASLKSGFGEPANIADPEVVMGMIEDPHSDYWASTSPEKAYIKDKAKCSISEKNDPNNAIYMSRFLHCYFDGLNSKPPGFPQMKIRYISHSPTPVECSAIIPDCPLLGLSSRYRVVIHITRACKSLLWLFCVEVEHL